MSVRKTLVCERIHIRKSKEYRKVVKTRLKELIEAGDERAKAEYNDLFPKWETSEKREANSYEYNLRNRMRDTIPVMLCMTCGKRSDRVLEFEDPNLKREKRKTWKRLIRPNLNYKMMKGKRVMRNRRIFFAYNMLKCVSKRHKLTIRYMLPRTIKNMKFRY